MRTLSLISLCAGFALASCAPQAEEVSGEGEPEKTQDAAEEASAPDSISETAWLARAEDGARFVTYFDPGGTYRDMRNGDFMQSGGWTYADGPGGKQICLEPDEENGVKMCWQPDRMDGETMIAIGPEGRRIELQRVDYVPADAEGDEIAE